MAPRELYDTEVKMKKIVVGLTVLAAMVVAHAVQAAPACEWELNKADVAAVTLTEGDVVTVVVTTPASGKMMPPAGWVCRSEAPNACPGFPVGCANESCSKVVSTSDNGPATFTVENAGCANNARTFNLKVNAKATPPPPPDPNLATWTYDEKSRVTSHVDKARDSGRFDVSAALLLAPNLPTTTSVGTGAELGFGAIVVNSFKMALALNYMRASIPIEPALHPAVMAGSEDQWAMKVRLAWSPDLAWWAHLDLGGEVGYNGSHYSTTFVYQTPNGQVENIMQRTQHSPVFGPYLRLGLCPAEEFCFIGQFTNEIVLNRSRTIGENATAINGTVTEPESGHVQLNPTFGLGAAIYFGGK
jgi:hypothetical protein